VTGAAAKAVAAKFLLDDDAKKLIQQAQDIAVLNP